MKKKFSVWRNFLTKTLVDIDKVYIDGPFELLIYCWPNIFCIQEIPEPIHTVNIKIGQLFKNLQAKHKVHRCILYLCLWIKLKSKLVSKCLAKIFYPEKLVRRRKVLNILHIKKSLEVWKNNFLFLFPLKKCFVWLQFDSDWLIDWRTFDCPQHFEIGSVSSNVAALLAAPACLFHIFFFF